MKTTQYFNSQAELEAFYPNGVPNNVLAIVTDGTSGQASILMTSSNNVNGTPQEQGGEILTPETEARIDALEENKADKADTYTKTEVDELISSSEPDLSYYVTKEALSGMSYATESYVTSKISDVVGAAPETLDTLKELADALNDDAQFASYVAVELGKKADLANVYTKNEIQNMSYITSDALNGYATESYVTSAIAAIDIPDPDLTAYVSKTELDTMSYATQSYVYDHTINGSTFGNINYYTSKVSLGSNQSGTTSVIGQTVKLINYGNNTNLLVNSDGNTFVNGIGNFAGNVTSNSYSLQHVVNDNISRISALENAGYATEAYVTSAIEGIDIPDPDLSAYVTKNELESMSYATQSYVGSYVVNNTVHIVNITQNEYDTLTNEQKNDITKIYNIIDAQNVDISAFVSKVELNTMSYATQSYVAEYVNTYAPQPDLSAYVTKNDLDTMSYATQSYVTDKVGSINNLHAYTLTQAQYDILTNEEKNNPSYLYIISDSQGVNLSSYATWAYTYALADRITSLETAVGQAQQLSQVIVDGNNS